MIKKNSIFLRCFLSLCVTFSVVHLSDAAAQQTQQDLSLSVMTYNLRFASEEPPNAWSMRRPLMDSLLTQYAPDIIGTQEGLYQQLCDIENDLGVYRWIGLGREGGSRDEFCAIFYKDRFIPLAFDHFWLSDIPELIGSKTWGNKCARMLTWVLFRDRDSNRQFYVLNTHLDHQSGSARKNSAKLIDLRMEKFDKNIPSILVGDFNAVAGKSKPYDILIQKSGFVDAWASASERDGYGLNTYNGFSTTPNRAGERIDWILTRGPVEVGKIEIIDDQFGHCFPSDHFPVMAWLIVR